MREHPAPCRNATRDQALSGRHLTYNDVYCDRCKLSASTWIGAGRGRRLDDATTPSSLGASRYAAGLDAPACEPLATPQVQP